jgi:hypothetical protein
VSSAPWDAGFAHGKLAARAPTPPEFKKDWGYGYRNAVLFLFGFEQARGAVYPPNFREKLEWLLREPSKLDALVIAIDAMANDEPDALNKIAAFGLSTFNREDDWDAQFAARHGHRPNSQIAHRNLPPLPRPLPTIGRR